MGGFICNATPVCRWRPPISTPRGGASKARGRRFDREVETLGPGESAAAARSFWTRADNTCGVPMEVRELSPGPAVAAG
jgi:hypothetical protein